jgi:glutathione-specific gamma-glutamylcyclotransferase
MAEDVWVFGYGSLVWRPDFPYADRRPAWIEGWERRFWQGSTDHRGVPGAPGRVVTLVPDPGGVCWGMAYLIAGDEREAVMAHLDYREKGGYRLADIALNFADSPALPETPGLLYVATEDNPNYLGPAPLHAIAAQVVRSTGPSGPNIDYVLRLAEALREIGAHDEHVFALADLVRAGAG